MEASEAAENLPIPVPNLVQADTDARLIELWLYGRPARTVKAYTADLASFQSRLGKPIRAVTIGDLQGWLEELPGSSASRARRLASIKSLLSFATRVNYVPFNVGAAVRSPPVIRVLAERILSEEQVIRMLAMETNPRNHALIRLLYLAALRVSEICALRWKDCRTRKPAGQITVLGKRNKIRSILLPDAMWRELIALRSDIANPDDPAFLSRQGGALAVMSVERLVKAAAIRAGLPKEVSPHWLRHAACSHALDRGANPALVRDTAGHADLKVTSVYAHSRPTDSLSRYLIG